VQKPVNQQQFKQLTNEALKIKKENLEVKRQLKKVMKGFAG